ncbi:MAG: ABC transporter permease [Proteobacteria bacterium]|nr:ABC transporter permease [Pseudomonadota bacterium]
MIRRRTDIFAGSLAPVLAITLLAGSIVLGLIFLLAVGFGYLPALGGQALSLEPFRILLADERVLSSCAKTVFAGTSGTLAAVITAFALAIKLNPTGAAPSGWAQRLALAILAVPHAALALGLAFVIAPSGWMMRGLQALFAAWPLPPDWQFFPAESGIALALVLFLKEVPFLFFAILMGLHQVRPERHLLAARALGYADGMAWAKLVLPRLYPLVRFPILAVLAYSLSVVDMSLILGPTTPPTLPVLVLKWFNEPDLGQRFTAAAAALLQFGLVGGAILIWWLCERGVAALLRPWLSNGIRHMAPWLAYYGRGVLAAIVGMAVVLVALAVGALLLWSFANTWRYPALLPEIFDLATWRHSLGSLYAPLLTSLLLALCATFVALLLAVACLEHERVLRTDVIRAGERWLYLPLLVPEICFLLGLQVLLLLIGLNGTWVAVLWMHLLFVFPYVFLTLKEPWRAFDSRYGMVGLSLGQTAWQVFRRIKLPMLRAPLSWAAAVGCSVSLSLYLPTMQGGEGRISTLATEAVALSSGGDRRVMGVFGLIQTLLVGAFFLLALRLARPRRWRRG